MKLNQKTEAPQRKPRLHIHGVFYFLHHSFEMRRSGTCVMLVLFQAITSPLHSLERLHAIAPLSQRAMGASSILKSSGLASCIQDLKFAINYSSTTDTRLTVEDEVQYLLHLRGATVCKIQDKEEAADSRFISLAPHVSLSLSLSLSLSCPPLLSLSLLSLLSQLTGTQKYTCHTNSYTID